MDFPVFGTVVKQYTIDLCIKDCMASKFKTTPEVSYVILS